LRVGRRAGRIEAGTGVGVMTSFQESEVWELLPPVDEPLARELEALLHHKGSPWIEDIGRRLRGGVAGSEDHFYVARQGGRMVGHVWYNTSGVDHRLGLVGHIYTDPEYRRRGIAARLLHKVMADFRARGGAVMQLFTSTPYSVAFYQDFGFENIFAGQVYHATDWYMRYPSPSTQILDNWFHPLHVSIRQLRLADLPQYCLLYNCEHRSPLKDRAQRVGLGLEAESAFLESTAAIERGQSVCRVLENDETMVGIASMVRQSFPYQSHVALFDIYLLEAFQDNAIALARDCLSHRRQFPVDWLYAMAVEPRKRGLLDRLGFVSQGILADHYRVGSERFDCELFRLDATDQ
jgi:ribosomal protein S18 acetylase RimI-like enzyme